ncbi:MAG: hypothetical protein U0974_01875 [Gemmatimonadales bacterium]|nr:hypothetical protein [Gemmatimonadales bacterium]
MSFPKAVTNAVVSHPEFSRLVSEVEKVAARIQAVDHSEEGRGDRINHALCLDRRLRIWAGEDALRAIAFLAIRHPVVLSGSREFLESSVADFDMKNTQALRAPPLPRGSRVLAQQHTQRRGAPYEPLYPLAHATANRILDALRGVLVEAELFLTMWPTIQRTVHLRLLPALAANATVSAAADRVAQERALFAPSPPPRSMNGTLRFDERGLLDMEETLLACAFHYESFGYESFEAHEAYAAKQLTGALTGYAQELREERRQLLTSLLVGTGLGPTLRPERLANLSLADGRSLIAGLEADAVCEAAAANGGEWAPTASDLRAVFAGENPEITTALMDASVLVDLLDSWTGWKLPDERRQDLVALEHAAALYRCVVGPTSMAIDRFATLDFHLRSQARDLRALHGPSAAPADEDLPRSYGEILLQVTAAASVVWARPGFVASLEDLVFNRPAEPEPASSTPRR